MGVITEVSVDCDTGWAIRAKGSKAEVNVPVLRANRELAPLLEVVTGIRTAVWERLIELPVHTLTWEGQDMVRTYGAPVYERVDGIDLINPNPKSDPWTGLSRNFDETVP